MLRNSRVVGSLEGTEHGFDLGQLHVASPMDGGGYSREIGPQQVVSITQMGGLEFGFIDVESKRSPGHGLSGVGHLDADKTKRIANFFPLQIEPLLFVLFDLAFGALPPDRTLDGPDPASRPGFLRSVCHDPSPTAVSLCRKCFRSCRGDPAVSTGPTCSRRSLRTPTESRLS